MHAYYAKESTIPPLTIVPPSSMLSPMVNPQEFFLPKELLPLKKRGRDRVIPPLASDLEPQEFEIGEKPQAELRESRTQIAKLQRKQMGNNSKIALARFRISNLE
ncbi:hypothetical protein Tco_0512180 [Tanacetum coccineum]